MIHGSLAVTAYWSDSRSLGLTVCLMPVIGVTNGIFVNRQNSVYLREHFKEYTLHSLSRSTLESYKDSYGSTPDFIAWNPV